MLLLSAAGPAGADDLVAAHLAALRDSLGALQVQAVWLGQGWRDRLGSAIRQASDKFKGPFQNPDEPWHYDYHP